MPKGSKESESNAEPKNRSKPKKSSADMKYSYWKSFLPFLYDYIENQNFSRPLLSCRWGPCLKSTRRSYKQSLYFSEQTDGIVPNTLVIAECNFDKPNIASSEQIALFDKKVKKGCSPFLKVVKTIHHPGKVSRIREFPQYQSIIATHTNSPEVLIWDIQAQPDLHDAPLGAAVPCADLVLVGHTSNAEFALAMCSTQPYVLSGGKDTSVVFWSIQDHISTLAGGDSTASIVKTADSASLHPRGIFEGHTDTVEDVQFHPKSTQEFCSVGDDSCLILWDARDGEVPVTKVPKAHDLNVRCVDWNRVDDHYILTGSSDKSVCMFDRRKLIRDGVGTSVYKFVEHKAPVKCVQWCPDKHSVFGSSAEDGHVNIWDHTQADFSDAGRTTERGLSATGLLFKHYGHRAQVTDFHWNDHAPWTIVSVSASHDAELDNAVSDLTESDDDDDAELDNEESESHDAESDYTEFDDAELDYSESDNDETTSGGGVLQVWRKNNF